MLEYFDGISRKYNISLENVISIALNRYGLSIEGLDDNRIRFNLNILNSDETNFFAVCVNTYDKTPFVLENNMLLLDGKPIAVVSDIEKDTCTATYFRNDKKDITFNSNSRSKCVGCKFCGTYSLTDDDNINFSTKENVIKYFEDLLSQNSIDGMKNINSVTLCTGCFETEDDLVKHLLVVNDAFLEMGFKGRINYIGSQLRDYDKIDLVADRIGDFGLYLTIEKFLDRDKYMKPEKASLKLPDAKELLSYCSSIGVTNTFLYILGLENLETIEHYFKYFKGSINKFPIVQVFQNYTSEQENYRCDEAKNIEYYIKAREIIGNIFSDSDLRPKEWECFRGLHFNDNGNKGLVRCKKKV